MLNLCLHTQTLWNLIMFAIKIFNCPEVLQDREQYAKMCSITLEEPDTAKFFTEIFRFPSV